MLPSTIIGLGSLSLFKRIAAQSPFGFKVSSSIVLVNVSIVGLLSIVRDPADIILLTSNDPVT